MMDTLRVLSSVSGKLWDNDPVLYITARSMKIYEVGYAPSNDTALFDVGLDYIGDQRLDG